LNLGFSSAPEASKADSGDDCVNGVFAGLRITRICYYLHRGEVAARRHAWSTETGYARTGASTV